MMMKMKKKKKKKFLITNTTSARLNLRCQMGRDKVMNRKN